MPAVVHTPKAPVPAGPYVQAVIAGEFVYLSGQLPLNPLKDELITGSLAQSVRQTLANLRQVLISCNLDLKDVIKTTVYLTDMKRFDEFNNAYAEVFGEHKPARSVAEVSSLPRKAVIMIDAVAYGETL